MRSWAKLAVVAALLAALLVPSAVGSPTADLASVARDYARGETITPCRFTKAQLQRARTELGEDIENYATGIRPAINREIKRWNDRQCSGKRGYANLQIVAVQPKGGARSESVTIRNRGKKTANLRNYALRDADDHVLRLRATQLRAGRTLRIVTGCRSGHRNPVRRGSSYYACRTKQVWDDAGDLVELLGPGGGLLSQKKY